MNKILLLFLIIIMVLSVNTISAVELDNNQTDNIKSVYNNVITDSDNLLSSNGSDVLEESLDDETNDFNSIEIYVGNNRTDDGGNGSYDNPYNSLNLACTHVNGENNAIINIFDGTYYLDSYLQFNTSNLVINGLGSNVFIKNADNENHVMALGLLSSSANFTMSNLIEDHSSHEKSFANFKLFYGSANLGTFNNCSFLGPGFQFLTGANYNSQFNNCYIECTSTGSLFDDNFARNTNHLFNQCIIICPKVARLNTIYLPCNITFEDVWFGQNNLPSYITPGKRYVRDENNNQVPNYVVPVTRYAEFKHVDVIYKGNNSYEIIGKLTWNGTEDQDGMENFRPMTVELSYGDVSETVNLTNGTFKTVYTSNSAENRINIKLDNQPVTLNFQSINFTVDAPSIYYGEDQNITVTFPQVINANVTITVNNKSYEVYVNNTNSTTYAIKDINLTEGDYAVDVVLNDTVNNVYGSSSTVLSVSKVSVDDYFDYSIPSDVVYGQNATIIVKLPKDVAGSVIVSVGNDTKELSANETVSFDFTGLNADTYPVTISYSGSDKYTSKEVTTESLTINPAQSSVVIEPSVFTYGEVIAIPFTPVNATGVNVRVLNKDKIEVANTSGESIISLGTLPVGEYTLELTTIVTSNYEETTLTSTLSINKANSTLIISDEEFTYGEDAIVHVETVNSTGDVIATLIDANNKEISVNVTGNDIALPQLDAGKYTLTVTTNVDDNHNNFTDSAVITIVKVTPEISVVVSPESEITVMDDVIINVNLPTDATGLVLVEVNDIKKFDKLNEGNVEFTFTDLAAGDYNIKVTYLGDNNYLEATNDTESFTVNKLENTISVSAEVYSDGGVSIYVELDANEGEVTLFINNEEIETQTVDDGYVNFYLDEQEKGDYNVSVKYTGMKYADAEDNTTFSVDFGYMDVETDYYTVGENNTILIILPEDATGKITAIIGTETFNATVEKGRAELDISTLTEGDYDATIIYSGDDKYYAREYTTSIEINPITPEITYEESIAAGEDAIINITLPNTATGNVTVTFNNKEYTATLTNGLAIISVPDLVVGEYNTIDVYYSGDETYKEYTTSIEVYVSNVNVPSEISADQNASITITIAENATGNVTVITENNNYTAPVVNGSAVVDIPDLSVGKHELEIIYSGDENNEAQTWYSIVEVNKANVTIDLNASSVFVGDDSVLDIKLPSDATGIVLVEVEGKKYYGELNNGKISLTISDLQAGNHTAVVQYLGDAKYNNANGTTILEVESKEETDVNITIPSDIKIGGDNGVTLDLPKDATGNVTLTVDGKVVSSVPVVNGTATVFLDNLTSGNHIVEIAYSGDGKYAAASSTKTVTIEKQNTVIVADKTFTRVAVDTGAGEKGGMYYVILKDSNGKTLANRTVQIVFNGKVYNKVTDKNGRAGLKISLQAAGTYTYAISFLGDDTYNAAPLASSKLTVTKKKTTIKASNKVFKAKKKSKKISVTLKTVKNKYDKKTYLKSGKKVTLKVNGKTYTAKINKKGVAKFTIKINKKGKYTAKIKFAGDKTYKASSKKIKIRIK